MRIFFAFFGVNERNGDFSPIALGSTMNPMLRPLRCWLTVGRARREIQAVARQYCATARADSFRGATPKQFSFRIVFPTDRERDHLRREPQLYQQLSGALLRVGYPADAVPFVHFRIESQETVDQDYGGNWVEESEML